MNIVPLIQIPCYEFQASDSLIDLVLSKCDLIKFTKTETNVVSQYTNLDIPELSSWIEQCVDSVKNEIYPNIKGNLELTAVWMNRATKFQYHSKHSHANSLVSGIVYLSEPKKGGDTVFYYPNPWYSIHNDGYFLLDNHDNLIEVQQTVKPKKGKTIIFPSTIKHNVTPTLDNDIRYTIAFNAFITGKLGNPLNATGLNIESSTYDGKKYR